MYVVLEKESKCLLYLSTNEEKANDYAKTFELLGHEVEVNKIK